MTTPLWRNRYRLLTEAHLEVDRAVLARAFPQFELVAAGDRLAFRGVMTSNWGNQFLIEVRLQDRHPEQEPHLWVLEPQLPKDTAHRYLDGRICAHAEPYEAYKTTVASLVSVMAGWIFRYERRRLYGVSWEDPILSDGQRMGINRDGSLFLKE